MRLNTAARRKTDKTHEGARIAPIKAEQELRRSVMACMLWEDTFYESGQSIAERITKLVSACDAEFVAELAIEAREKMRLRHAPLLLLVGLVAKEARPPLVADTIERVIRRADEPAELINMYHLMNQDHHGKRRMLPHQMRRGLQRALRKFDEYQLAKYDRPGPVRLRDVFRLVRPKPDGAGQAELWGRAVRGELSTPDTWETNLSAGGDKREVFTRMLEQTLETDVDPAKLGYMALIRNLRNMVQAGVDRSLIIRAIKARRGARMVLPFRYYTAAKQEPSMAKPLHEAMLQAIEDSVHLPGSTVICVDLSGSMGARISDRSQVTRCEVAAALASLTNGDDIRVVGFGTTAKELGHMPGIAGIDRIVRSNHGVGHGTNIGAAVRKAQSMKPDRIIVITDGQSHDSVPGPGQGVRGYMINVAAYRNGVGYGAWTMIDGWSEHTIRYIAEMEQTD